MTKPKVTVRAMRVFDKHMSSRFCFEIVLVTHTMTKVVCSNMTYVESSVALRAGRRFVENIAIAAR